MAAHKNMKKESGSIKSFLRGAACVFIILMRLGSRSTYRYMREKWPGREADEMRVTKRVRGYSNM